jgi:hypothetical protein
MGFYDVVLVLSWVLVVIALCAAAGVLMGADWREMWTRLVRRGVGRERI